MRRRPPERWSWRRWVAVGAIIGTASVVGCNQLQRRLVYPARHYDHAAFERNVQERFGPNAFLLAPFDGIVIEPSAPAVATAIWFHGNGNVNSDFASLAPVFNERRVRLALAEYPGYGARAGTPSEHALVDDGIAFYRAIASRYPRQPIIIIGQSLGSGVAAQVAADISQPAPGRLILATPFFNLPDAASHALWDLPLRRLVSERYDSADALVRYAGPVTIVVAAEDRFIGAEAGRRLARLRRPQGTTTLVELPGADHNDWLAAVTPALWNSLLAIPNSKPAAAGAR
jgi:pimeloyl-ACP methyl ester carboxylesterase